SRYALHARCVRSSSSLNLFSTRRGAEMFIELLRSVVGCDHATPTPRRRCQALSLRNGACVPSDPRRTGFGMPPPALPLATAEFLAVDVETNGATGEDCELTEVGTVLIGGGELHERFESLVRVRRPLSRGIQRFTGITQEMVAEAAPPARVLPEVAR